MKSINKPESSSEKKDKANNESAFGHCGELRKLFYDYEPVHYLARRNFIVNGYFILISGDNAYFLKTKFLVKECGVSNPNLAPELMICYNLTHQKSKTMTKLTYFENQKHFVSFASAKTLLIWVLKVCFGRITKRNVSWAESENRLIMSALSVNKILLFLIFSSISSFYVSASQITDYMTQLRTTGKSDFQIEKDIVSHTKRSNLLEELTPFYSDTLVNLRKKAYYLTYKKGIQSEKGREKIVSRLTGGCFDANGGIVGQNLSYLQEFSYKDFNPNSKNNILILLKKKQVPHYKELILLAGYVGCGTEFMNQKLVGEGVDKELTWFFSLALARQGDKEHLNFCLETIKNVSISNEMVSGLVPYLIYTRQKESIDYCVEILNNDEKLCHSPNPDKSEKILCGYSIMELLAPIIENFPYKTDASGTIVAKDYEKALEDVRIWIENYPDYKILNNTY